MSSETPFKQYTIFDFPPTTGNGGSNVYNIVIEDDSFIQLMILGNIIQHRKGGTLEGVAQHLEDFCRIKHETLAGGIGSTKRLRINDHVHLNAKLSRREFLDDLHGEDNPPSVIRYVIEVRHAKTSYYWQLIVQFQSLLIQSSQLLYTLELYLASTVSSMALVLRSIS